MTLTHLLTFLPSDFFDPADGVVFILDCKMTTAAFRWKF